MRRIQVMAPAVGLLLLLGGCAGSRQAGKASIPGDCGKEQPAQGSTSPGPASPCLEAHGFAILSFRAVRDDYNQVSIIGEIKNIDSASRGVELQASLRDAGGRLISVGHFCPASNRNIVPNEVWPFTYSFGRQGDAVEAELRIVGAFRTMDILNVTSTTP